MSNDINGSRLELSKSRVRERRQTFILTKSEINNFFSYFTFQFDSLLQASFTKRRRLMSSIVYHFGKSCFSFDENSRERTTAVSGCCVFFVWAEISYSLFLFWCRSSTMLTLFGLLFDIIHVIIFTPKMRNFTILIFPFSLRMFSGIFFSFHFQSNDALRRLEEKFSIVISWDLGLKSISAYSI